MSGAFDFAKLTQELLEDARSDQEAARRALG
jgi:hypothetical protein